MFFLQVLKRNVTHVWQTLAWPPHFHQECRFEHIKLV